MLSGFSIRQTFTHAHAHPHRGISQIVSHSFGMEQRLTTALCCNVHYSAYELLVSHMNIHAYSSKSATHKLIKTDHT